MTMHPKTLGCLEYVSLPEMGLDQVLAKIDTGAYSGAMHCSDIKVIRRGIQKKRILKYTPLGKTKLAKETDQFLETYVRSASGHRLKRFIVTTQIEVRGHCYPIKIGLSDRSDMKRAILIGRRFLRENNLLVDVRINQEYDDDGETTK